MAKEGSQPSTRQDLFGTEGIGEDDDLGIGTSGHSSQGGIASSHTGGSKGRKSDKARQPGQDTPMTPTTPEKD